ncbi:hypothetical protein GCM10010528_11840 [Gordonia defluvii]|jgi:hypothetical protein|uniref:DUF3592 domain-containing protein n=1 Tax=Gordonia defluvii TaxID=283718 RepID=A0ABP6L8I7_9ACTN|nr:hypothetical protein [Gordonia sp. UBA5067]
MWTLLIAGVLAATAVALIIGMRGRKMSVAKLASMSEGSLTVTGANPRPEQGDANNEAYLTISGTIMGPGIAPTEVYGTFARTLTRPWPQIGQNFAVRYDPRKVESSWVLIDGVEPDGFTPADERA